MSSNYPKINESKPITIPYEPLPFKEREYIFILKRKHSDSFIAPFATEQLAQEYLVRRNLSASLFEIKKMKFNP